MKQWLIPKENRGWLASGLVKGDWIWLFGAIGFGGILGPILLMFGLQLTSAATTSLLLNFEAVLTALLAWVIFKEDQVLKLPSRVCGTCKFKDPTRVYMFTNLAAIPITRAISRLLIGLSS